MPLPPSTRTHRNRGSSCAKIEYSPADSPITSPRAEILWSVFLNVHPNVVDIEMQCLCFVVRWE